MERSQLASSIAGFTASLGSIILFPLEMIKVRLIVSDAFNSALAQKYKSPIHALKSLYSNEGALSLYRGWHISLCSSFAWTVYFYFYESAKKRYSADFKQNHPEIYRFAVAAEAAVISRIITNPLWVIKTRVMLQNHTHHWYGDTIEAITKIYKLDGIKGYFSGLVPGLILCSNGAFQLYFYELLKEIMDGYNNSGKIAIAGGASKLLSTIALYPMQSVMVKLQQEQYGNLVSKSSKEIKGKVAEEKLFEGFWNCIVKTWNAEGYKGFYRGLSVQLLRILPTNALFFLIYEKTYKFIIDL
ncbi:unnamed protein product [Blepharisma stoltei]|uniref:Mitochondrial carrier protein n=1 Tax=Blepharisma stoltei TaxID=1481888 RepID=A0AAU9J3Q0_9CILI|nr:unnamed protein product [Blepharisma stoltei]